QIPNAVFGGLIVDIHGSAALHDDAPDGFSDRHYLIEAHTAFIAVRTLATANRPEYFETGLYVRGLKSFLLQGFRRDIDRLFTVVAQLACQSLRNNKADR